MNERMEEQASLHVLGALTPQEAVEFKQAIAADPELKEYVARLSTATGALAGSVMVKEPSADLRAKVLASAGVEEKIVLMPPEKSGAVMLPWALAACLLVLCGIFYTQKSALRENLTAQTSQLHELERLTQSLQAATNSLQHAVLALQETNKLANVRIALLNSLLSDAPKAVAVSLWDDAKQEGVFMVQNLKPLPAGRDYQLWVIDSKYKAPVDAGVFQVDDKGNVRLIFKAKAPINAALKFAVTEEAKGGVASPTMASMVLIGG
jgi:anti-sigma-K factor RskA